MNRSDTGSTKTLELDFWDFIELAKQRLTEHGFEGMLETELHLTLYSVVDIIAYDLEASIHRPRGRTWSAFALLFTVWVAGPIESKKAAELTGLSRAVVSSMTKPLVAEGLLVREANERDGRSVLLSATDKTNVYLLDTLRDQMVRQSAWMSTLTDADQRTLIRLLKKLINGRDHIDVLERR